MLNGLKFMVSTVGSVTMISSLRYLTTMRAPSRTALRIARADIVAPATKDGFNPPSAPRRPSKPSRLVKKVINWAVLRESLSKYGSW